MRVAVLAYHANNMAGSVYRGNDHIALASDLELLARLDLPVISLHQAVAMLRDGAPGPERAVALSSDDAPVFDWHDLDYPGLGLQHSFRRILHDHQHSTGRAVHMTCFAIASPQARTALDRECLQGRDWMRDDWWPEAAASELMAIENHSWDHNHTAVARSAQRDNLRGTFRNIETLAEADAEILQAADWLDAHCPKGPRRSLFAYPYGEFNDYLSLDYLPGQQSRHRVRAAFTVEPRPIGRGDSPWLLGRFVAGFHWREPTQLEGLLRESLGLPPA